MKQLLAISRLGSKQKTIIVLAFNAIVSFIAFLFSLMIRFGQFDITDLIPTHILFSSLFFVALSQSFVFYFFGIHKGIIRFSSIPDLIQIFKAASIATITSAFILFFVNRLEFIPRTSFVIDWIFLIFGLGGGRFFYRIIVDTYVYNIYAKGSKESVLIVGAGVAGNQLFREIRNNPNINYYVVGFIDDSSALRGKSLHNLPILGTVKQLPTIIDKIGVQKIFIAIPSANSKQIKNIVESCKDLNLDFKTLPKYQDLIDGKIEVSQLRNLKIEDLLGRETVELDTKGITQLLKKKIILITGAGGSIGSELCVQISKFTPQEIILTDFSEYNLYQIDKKLKNLKIKSVITSRIMDVRDQKSVDQLFEKLKPEVVFHTAAYKHVPLMEDVPQEAIRTNVIGTSIVAKASLQYCAETFIMVSTDKAVNPTNIMGASKRIAEMVCNDLHFNNPGMTKFITVRFGNVLGSSGSVIPLFKEQIESGGPVTVTHPEINRFFMSIPEAAQLILQSASIGEGGEIFVLEMGEPIKIIDLARQMIQLAGLKIDEDIKIEFCGLRPGEKLYEELLADKETTVETRHPKLRIAKVRKITDQNSELIQLLLKEKINEKITLNDFIIKLVPEYIKTSN